MQPSTGTVRGGSIPTQAADCPQVRLLRIRTRILLVALSDRRRPRAAGSGPMHSKMRWWIMRLLAATIGALLISVSHPALAQERHGGLPQDAWQQAEPQPEMQQPEIQQPVMTEPQAEQAEMQPPAMPELPATPEPQTEQSAVQPPAMPQPQMEAGVQDAALPRDAKWTVFVEPSLGTRMDLPSAVFTTADGTAYRGVGRQFKTADGRAVLAIYSQRNNQRDTPASYLRKNFSFPRATVSYERITRDFFAVSGTREGMIFYSRCNVAATGATLHCFDLQFPAPERTAWDAIVTRMSRSLRPLNRS